MRILFAPLLIAPALLLAAPPARPAPKIAAPAPRPAARLGLGRVDREWREGATYTPTGLDVRGRVRMTSRDYDLSAEDVTATLSPPAVPGGPPTVQKAVARPAPGARVSADIRVPAVAGASASEPKKAAEAYKILADKAVYLPDADRPGYGRLEFTGHVVVDAQAGFSVGPARTTTDHATVFFGPNDPDDPKFPSVETGPGHLTLTPTP